MSTPCSGTSNMPTQAQSALRPAERKPLMNSPTESRREVTRHAERIVDMDDEQVIALATTNPELIRRVAIAAMLNDPPPHAKG